MYSFAKGKHRCWLVTVPVTARLPPYSVQASLAGKAGAAEPSGHAPASPASNGTSNGAVKAPAANGASNGTAAGPGGIAAYDKLLQEQLAPFMEQASALGGEVRDHACF